jgi:hypothetical protein
MHTNSYELQMQMGVADGGQPGPERTSGNVSFQAKKRPLGKFDFSAGSLKGFL